MLMLSNQVVEWRKIEEGFNKRWNMPNCIGAIDGKHIDIQVVPNSGSYYFNYKVRNSIVLMEMVDSNHVCLYWM